MPYMLAFLRDQSLCEISNTILQASTYQCGHSTNQNPQALAGGNTSRECQVSLWQSLLLAMAGVWWQREGSLPFLPRASDGRDMTSQNIFPTPSAKAPEPSALKPI